MKLRFMVRAVQGGEFDTWMPVAGGPVVIRPPSAPKRGSWAGHEADYSKLIREVHALFAELGFPIENWFTQTVVDFSSPGFPELVRRLTHYGDAGLLYPSKGWLFVEPVEDSSKPFEWFYLKVPNSPHRFLRTAGEALPCFRHVCRANTASLGQNAMIVPGLSTVVNERFKELCDEFTGAEFLWLKDGGRFLSPQWFVPIAQAPLGARVDHPWFDPTKRPPRVPAPHNRYRVGVNSFKRAEFREGVSLGNPEADRMMSLFPTDQIREDVSVVGPYMALREFLPNADFAYIWYPSGGTGLCIARRVRDKLIAAGLVKSDECVPIVVVDEPPPGTEVLDGRVEVPPPLLHGDALFAAKTETAYAYAEHLRNPKPARCIDLNASLEMLRDAIRKEPRLFRPGATAEELDSASAELPSGIPAAWRKVLQIANGFRFSVGDGYETVRGSTLPRRHNELQASARAAIASFPTTLLHITTGAGGDWHSLDLSRLDSHGDCPVLQYDHETLQQQREWPCVGAFIEELLLETFADQDA
ncbi:MAG: SMI1/KNR4 family protein [Verrucomicrobia bacterium]|nr:SMI1/KNR4 family protein [Verrucomicrobiota bacterium]